MDLSHRSTNYKSTLVSDVLISDDFYLNEIMRWSEIENPLEDWYSTSEEDEEANNEDATRLS